MVSSKLPIGHPLWRCDSPDHNESTGCSNPQCFKYNGVVSPEWQKLQDDVDKLWAEIRAHDLKTINDSPST